MRNQHDLGRREGEFVISTPTEIENELPFQLVGVGVDFFQYPVDRPFGFPVFQWIQTVSGSGVLENPEDKTTTLPGSGLLLYPDEAHRYYPVGDDWYVHWITFSGHDIENMLAYLRMERTQVYNLAEPLTTEALIRKGYQMLISDYPLRGIDGSGIVYQLLLDFLKYVQTDKTASRNAHHMRLKPVMDYVEQHLSKAISIDELAATLDITPQYFCDLFRTVTGLRPVEYINRRRIDRARELLLTRPNMPIHDIAQQTGFGSNSYFSTVFRKLEGITPLQYRQQNADSRQLAPIQ
jgi:AraC-like DNA-binding protein